MSAPAPPALWRVFVPRAADAPDGASVRALGASLFRVEASLASRSVDGEFELCVIEPGSLALRTVRGQSLPLERAAEDLAAGARAARAMGGAGMDAFLARAQRVWRLRADGAHGADGAWAVAALAGVLAQAELGPALPPDERRLMGIRGVRAWIDAHASAPSR